MAINIARRASLAVGLLPLLAAQALAQAAVTVPGSEGAFELDPRSAKVDDHLGRRAIFLRAQTPPVFLSGVDFVDGTIEFDLAPMPGANFFGLLFRFADPFYHENIYFRLHRSGSFEALQYAPRVNSTAGSWQLYPEFMTAVAYPVGAWTRVRAEVSGTGLRLFVGDTTNPALVVPRLRGTTPRGRVAFWGRVNNRPEEWSAAISNVRVRSTTPIPAAVVDTSALPAGTLTGWQVAGPFEAPDSTAIPALPPGTAYAPIALEENGLLNLSRRLQKPRSGRHVAFLRNTIRSPADAVVPLEIGYSDDAIVWLNGAPIFRGSNGFNSRYPGFLGLVQPQAETLFLPLKAGDNALVIALAERTFGWGARVRLLER